MGEKREIVIFGNKRSESEILAQILYAAESHAKKTQLLYKANISYTHFIKYFDFLLDKNFIEIKEGNPYGTVYQTTEKGEQFLDSINNILEEIK